MENFKDKQEYLQFEKEVRQLKEIAECNALDLFYSIKNKFSGHSEKEAAALAKLYMMDNSEELAGQVSIYEFIGSPPFIPSELLSNAQLQFQVDYLIGCLEQNQIFLEFPDSLDNRDLYDFILQELFSEMIDNVRIPGCIAHYDYEEFYPDPHQTVETIACSFLSDVLNSDAPIEYCPFAADEFEYKNELIPSELFIEKLISFRELFSFLRVNSMCVDNLEINEDNAEVSIEAEYHYMLHGSNEKETASTSVKLKLVQEDEFWYVYSVQMEGIPD